ncbi:MAG: hypothetical protein V1887_04540 [Candidatus Aenigmatarchaeota archaeon]
MDDLEQLKRYDREIEEQKKWLDETLGKKTKLQSRIAFDRTPEGDSCKAREGDRVMILREGDYKGKVGVVHERMMGTMHYENQSKSFAVYEVLFSDNTILTFHHTVLKKMND